MIGSISHATMRPRDLIPCFADELEWLVKESASKHTGTLTPQFSDHLDIIRECRELTEQDYESEDPETIERIGCILNEDLFYALNEYSPEYCYFGSHPGDGSDYGFWIDHEAINEAIADHELLKVDDLANAPLDFNGPILVVNDHGNATFYAPQVEYKEVWSVV